MNPNYLTDRDAIAEQMGDFPVRLAAPLREALAACPEPFRPWLWDVVRECSPEPGGFPDPFLDDVVRLGLVGAVLSNIDADDLSPPDNIRRASDGGNDLPNIDIVPAAIRYALEHDGELEWRSVAARWARHYLPAGECVRVLTATLGRCSGLETYHAAVALVELAPDTPGLAEGLVAATCADWARTRREEWEGKSGPVVAVSFLERTGMPAMVPALCEALASGRCRVPERAARLYLGSGGNPAELVRRSWDASPCRTAGEAELLSAALRELPSDTEGLADRLAALIAASDGHHAIPILARTGCRGDVVLPWLATQLNGYVHLDPSDLCCRTHLDVLRDYLDTLPECPMRWVDDDRWVAALRGQPYASTVWAVYADWLGDRGDPREELVQACHALASFPGAEAPASRLAAWVAGYGGGWERVYATIASF